MIKLFLESLEFLRSCAPLFVSLAVFTLLAILLSKSIKKHSKIYYTVLSIPFFLVSIPLIGELFGVEIMSFSKIPFLGSILRDYMHMAAFGHPLLIIIMYMGALNPRNPSVKKLLSIRKELSIISGFPVLTHALIRVTYTFPNALKFFTNNAEYMENTKAVSELGLAISNFSFVLGIVMLTIFIPLWVTSFKSIHKRMGGKRWKKLQRWSYVLYAILFIHAMGIQVGGILNPRGGHKPAKPVVEVVMADGQKKNIENTTSSAEEQNKQSKDSVSTNKAQEPVKKEGEKQAGQDKQGNQQRGGRHGQASDFASIEIDPQTKQYIHVISLLLVYGSYLFLRLRKARNDAKKKANVK